MFDDAGRVVFAALRAAAAERLGAVHPCTQALAAAEGGGEAVAAQSALLALADADRDAVMETAHRALRSDARAWLMFWGGGGAV